MVPKRQLGSASTAASTAAAAGTTCSGTGPTYASSSATDPSATGRAGAGATGCSPSTGCRAGSAASSGTCIRSSPGSEAGTGSGPSTDAGARAGTEVRSRAAAQAGSCTRSSADARPSSRTQVRGCTGSQARAGLTRASSCGSAALKAGAGTDPGPGSGTWAGSRINASARTGRCGDFGASNCATSGRNARTRCRSSTDARITAGTSISIRPDPGANPDTAAVGCTAASIRSAAARSGVVERLRVASLVGCAGSIRIEALPIDLLAVGLVLLVGPSDALLILAEGAELQLNVLRLTITDDGQCHLIADAHLPHLVDECISTLQILAAKLADDIAFAQPSLSGGTVGMNLDNPYPIVRLLQPNPRVRSVGIHLRARLGVALPSHLRLRVRLLSVLLLIGLLVLLTIRPLVLLTVIGLAVIGLAIRLLIRLTVIRLAIGLLILRIGQRLLTRLQPLAGSIAEALTADRAPRRLLDTALHGTAETRLNLAAVLSTRLPANPARLRGSRRCGQRHHGAQTGNRASS